MNETTRWYEPNEDDENDQAARAGHLISETAAIESRQSSWYELNRLNATLYTNREPSGYRWGEPQEDQELWPANLRTENLIEEIGEAMLSKASSSPLKPTLVPHGKSWKVERAVRLLDEFLFGVWVATRAEDACVLMFRDAFMAGLGCVRVGYEDDAITVESVFFDNIVIDNRECGNRQSPRTYRIRRCLPIASVEEKYDVDLHDDESVRAAYTQEREVGDGWAVVVEAWRPGGRHTIACGKKLLLDEAWPHDWVPLVFFHWQDRTNGFFVKGGVEQLVPFQVRHNELNDVIELSQDLVCRPRLLINANSMIDVSQWDNEAGRILMWSGSKPEPFDWTFRGLSDLYQERERNRSSAFSHMAMSEMFANADMPQQVRLDSSAGVREFRNMEDARHLRLWSRFEAARLAVARTILNVLSIESGADAFSSTYHPGGSKASAKNIPWEAVKTLKDDKYSWTMDATPLAAMSPAARRELLRDFTSRGLVDPQSAEARRMEGNPNLERIEDLELASDDDITRHLSLMEDGDFEAPTELTNTTLGIRRVTANYHRLKAYEDVKQKVLDAHINWIVKATTIQQAAVQQAPQGVAFQPTQGMPGTSASMNPHTVVNDYA